MATVTREIWIDAPKEKIWEALADFGNISHWNPTVPNSYLTSEQTEGVGMTRHCDLSLGGGSVEERVVEWTEGQSMTIEIYAGKRTPPFKKAYAHFNLSEERGGTRVVGALDYTLKMGPVGALMDNALVKGQFTKTWNQLLAGLEYYVKTGEKVAQPSHLDLSAVQAVAA